MAEEEKPKKMSMMVIIILIVVGLILAGGISYLIATRVVADKTTDKITQREPGQFIKLGDAKEGLILNIGGVNSGRYLKIGLIVELRPDKNAASQEGKLPSPEEIRILDTAVYVLRTQKIEDFDPLKQDQLKEMLKNEINKTLGEDRVYDIYITNFVLQ
ncbi:flagellar basal body-associated FliL family protein [Sporomusa termitida]|uniref:Flagellar protein FliL n=1 Tax=Sporomusa termitida TaxID=2377 RepID=A0A517DT26_9FIRM|nr:flagellar basal body-associated FliL family protein [Sporomusa termitida]QDR80499.1 Flagellar basal body-associated protein FliL [Sporomusa termitida]